jgi:hypothetical protein
MIPAITEINFPAYATLHQATVSLSEMGDRVISTQVRIDGDVVPDFSGWELSFKGERFVLNTKEPQAMKDNSTRHSLVDLTFESWIARELKRYFFFEAASVNASTAIADKYKASVNLNIEDFVVLYNTVLDYYFGGSVVMSLYMSGQGQYSTDRALMEIDYTYLWDVLVKFYEVYDVRWTIEFDSSTGVYTIKVGYPPASIDDHVFEYGFSGGLLKFERQVQDVDIHNILLGRGGEKNIPYRYFKRTDPQNPDWTADPDAIPELSNIYFDRLRDINFRWYVRGWMQNPNRDTSWEDGGYVYPVYSDIPEEYAWAYERGRTDEKFNPVEYVKDDESIAEYGERWGALDDNDEIYPTIQGVTRAPIGRIDETVAVSEIVTDDIEAMSRSASVETSINEIRVALQEDTETQFQRLSEEFTIPAGSVGDISYVPFGDDTANPGLVRFDTENSTVVATADGVDYPISGIPAGTYRLKLNMVIHRDSPATSATGTFGIQNIVLTTSAMDADAWKPTFDIWVKNIWGTTKLESESEEQYAERVWLPILGDRAGNEAKIVFSTGFMSVSQDYEFTIASYPVHDTSKSINGVPSEWRITLRKSDAEFDVTGLYLPNATTGGQPIAGDKFFFIGIDMPFYYVQLAEEDINTYKSSELDTVASINPTWIITLDKVRANTRIGNEIGEVLADRITAGTKLKITDPRFTPGKILTLYAQSVTYTWQEPTNESPYIVPDIEVVLSDKVVSVESTITRIQNDVSYVKNQYARISDVEAVVRSVAEPIFLKKTGESDSSASPTQFSSKVTSKGFRQGSVGGSGWGIYRDNTDAFRQQATRAATRALSVPEEDPEGDAVIEADRIVVRKELQVNSLVINQIAYVGGKEIISAAKIEVTKVIETNDGYICYFDQKRNSVANNFALNDIAFGQVFNPDNTELRYYKMVVTATDIDSITLAKSGRDGSGAPEVGDIIVQYGNTTNANRQYVIVRDVVGGGYERMISNLNSVSATGKEYYFAGRQGTSGPRWFVGDSLGDYAEYVNGVLTIKANVIFKAGQTIPGLSELEDEVSGLSGDVSAMDYLKTALPQSDTIITGGLILSKVIALRDANNAIKSGINGDPSLSSIAAWYGGQMADKEASPTPSSYAQSLFRFDGSGYLAGGKITWGDDGAGSIPGVSWSADGSSIIIGGNVKLASASGDSVTELLSAVQSFPSTYLTIADAARLYHPLGGSTTIPSFKIGGATLTWHPESSAGAGDDYLEIDTAIITAGDQIVISGTPGQGGGGGEASYIYELKDTLSSWIGRPSVSETQVLVFDPSSNVHDKNGNNGAWKYVNASSIGGVTSVVGQTGAVTAAQIATALTSAGYKLTDHEYTNGYGLNLSNGEFSLTQAVRDSLGLADTALQAASIKTLTLKVGTTTIGSAYNPIGSSNQTLTIAESNLTALLNDNYHPLYGEHDASAEKYFWIGGAKFVWHPAVGGTDGYLELQSAIVTTGDQIVNSGTPGGGGSGGGAGYLYELGDVYHDNDKTKVLRPNGQQRDNGDVLSFDSALGVWVALQKSSLLAGYALESYVDSEISDSIQALNLGAASTYGVGTVASGNGGLVTGGSVYSAINDAISSALKFQGITTTSISDGSTTNPIVINGSSYTAKKGDVVLYDGREFLWTGSAWEQLGDEVSWALKTTTISAGTGLTGGGTLAANRTISLNSETIASLALADTAYQKPSTGIPKSDLASGVQASLGLADTAYQKPSGGIPNSDIATPWVKVGTTQINLGGQQTSLAGLVNVTMSGKLTIGDAEIEWIPNSGNGYLKINKPLLTVGDQIVNSGTPGGGGGGGGAGFLYELGDVLTDSGHTVVKQYDGTTNAANNNLFAFNGSKWYALKLGTNLAITNGTLNATDTTYSNGTGLALSNGVFSITSAYQTDIANGASAYSTLTTSQTKNKVLASPSSASGAPSFRALVAADIPSLTVSKITDIASNYVSIATANTITAKHTFSNGILLNTASSWTSSDRAIAFSADGEDANIRYYNTDSNKGLTFNPNTGELKAAKFTRRGGTSSQFLKADGSVDSSSYITGNQTITLSGDVSGSGTTSISVSIGSGKVTNAMLAGSIAWSKLSVSASNITSTLGTTAVSRATADADGNTISSTYVKKAGDSMTGGLAICLTPSSSYPVDRTKATLIVEDDSAAATGEIQGGNIIISRGYTATANQSAGAITFYGRRLSGGYRNGARIASIASAVGNTYDRQDLVFYASNNTSDSAPTFEEAMRIRADKAVSMSGWLSVSRDGVYNIYTNNTASDGTATGIRFQLNGTTKGGLFVSSDENLYYSVGTASTGNKVLTSANYDSFALPLSAGSSYPLTGHLYLNEGLGIQAAGGIGLLVYHPTSGWTGIDSTQWGLGSINSQGVIRSNNNDLLHYKGSSSYSIWDASNSGISTMPWACSTLSVNTSLTLPNDVSILGTLTDSTTASMIKMSTSNNIVVGSSSFAHNVNLYGTLVKFYAGGTTAIGTVSSTGLDVTGTVTASGIGTFDRVVLSNSGAVSHIEFTRASWNYVSVPTDGVIAFNVGGSGSANTIMAVTPDGIRAGTKGVHSCGLPTAYWGSIYGKDLYLGGDTHNTAAGSIIFSEKLDSQRNGFKIAPVHATSANRVNLVFYRSNNGNSPWAASWTTFMTLSYDGKVTIAGSLTTSGDQVISSDATLKTNWRELNYTVKDIANAKIGIFDWKDGHGTSAGSVAQDWKKLIPELVHGDEGNMTLAYGQIALLNTVMLARRSEDHEARIKALELENAELRKEIERLRS